jgi:glycosyltransferase involved in cell wall biosynthesis
VKIYPSANIEVSVILTVFNREEYLERCISSVIRQSFTNWELIAIDDGSRDNTLNILKEYRDADSRIKVMSHENIKPPLSRNKGIIVSQGKYITFLDSDDEYERDHLRRRVEYMNENAGTDMICGGVNIIGNEYVRDKNNPLKFIHLSECSIGGTFFGRRKVFLMLNGFKNLEYSDDSDFFERAKKYFHIEKVNFNTYKYHREDPGSITNRYFSRGIN